jgi:hypothetical protein
MMNIVVFETETWAQTAWQRMKDDHEVRLLEEFLTSLLQRHLKTP